MYNKAGFKKVLKESIKGPVFAVVGGDDYVTVVSSHALWQIQRRQYAELVQPVTLREAPEPGEVQQWGSRVSKTWDEWQEFLSWMYGNSGPAVITDFILSAAGEDHVMTVPIRIFATDNGPIGIDEKYINALDVAVVGFQRSGLDIVAGNSSTRCHIMPIQLDQSGRRMTAVKAICAEYLE